jgi:hypothetical protein
MLTRSNHLLYPEVLDFSELTQLGHTLIIVIITKGWNYIEEFKTYFT